MTTSAEIANVPWLLPALRPSSPARVSLLWLSSFVLVVIQNRKKKIKINNYDNNNSNDNIEITVISGLRWSPFGRAVSVSTLYVISFLNFLELKPC